MISPHGGPHPMAALGEEDESRQAYFASLWEPPRNDIRLDWRGSSGPDYMAFRYMWFHGCEWRVVRIGRRGHLWLRYQADLRRGRLYLELADHEGLILWQCCLRGSGSARIKIPILQPGVYQLRVRGENASGAFDLRWRARATRRRRARH
ncbi:MAG: hypothetical protein HPY83_18405 [Anaerolineae bacterium]|nr:hypothetical protein [Anaerolineae bacterium]